MRMNVIEGIMLGFAKEAKEVRLEQKKMLATLSLICWCKYWDVEKKAKFIKKFCKKLGMAGYEKEFSIIVMSSPQKCEYGFYPRCLDRSSFGRACILLKIFPDALIRMRNAGDDENDYVLAFWKAHMLFKDAGINF